jgi:hypothetical protein
MYFFAIHVSIKAVREAAQINSSKEIQTEIPQAPKSNFRAQTN